MGQAPRRLGASPHYLSKLWGKGSTTLKVRTNATPMIDRMSDTKVLLKKITALRQRLDQAQTLAGEAGAALASVTGQAGMGRIALLEKLLAEGAERGRGARQHAA